MREIKYMGSKSRIAKDIVPIIQSYIDEAGIENYCEPFCGGCNIIDKIRCNRKLACDLNQYLIALLIHVRDGGELYDSVSRELYNKAKAAFKSGHNSEFRNWQIGNIGFLGSFNGKFFDGGYAKAGYKKTGYRDYYREAKNNLLKQAPKLKGIDFMVSDYKNINLSGSKYVIYADPPPIVAQQNMQTL